MKKLFSAVLASVMVLASAVSVFAADEKAIFKTDKYKSLRATSAFAEDFKASDLFDCDSGTAFTVTETGNECKVFVSVGVPQVMKAFAAKFISEKGTYITIYLSATNTPENDLSEWDSVEITSGEHEEDNWSIFTVNNDSAYSFYCFEFVLDEGAYFGVSEISLLRDLNAKDYKFAPALAVNYGELPEIVEVKADTMSDSTKAFINRVRPGTIK